MSRALKSILGLSVAYASDALGGSKAIGPLSPSGMPKSRQWDVSDWPFTLSPFSVAICKITTRERDGMTPDFFQPQTVAGDLPKALAVFLIPPNAVRTILTGVIPGLMPQIGRRCNKIFI